MKKIIYLMLLCFLTLPIVSVAMADDISDVNNVIQDSMNDVMKIIKDESTNGEQKRGLLWEVVLKTFDFEKITEFSLGKFSSGSKAKLGEYSDRRFSPEQHAEFQVIFTQHVGNTYLDRLEFDGSDVTVDVEPARMLKPKKKMKRARVNSIINGKTPVEYQMLKRNAMWKAYDVKVEGRSLVSAFRKEYKSVLIKHKPEYLIDLIKGKLKAHDEAKAKKDNIEKNVPK
jgi:phospholipid transport system substrate-binding protein